MATKTLGSTSLVKRCRKCEEVKPRSSFHLCSSTRDGLQHACKECHNAYRARKPGHHAAVMRAWRQANPDRQLGSELLARYGLTIDAYRDMLESQGGVCAICGSSEPRGKGRWHIDHDHRCCPGDRSCGQCIRGLLCFLCNSRVLPIVENAGLLNKALAYLDGTPS